MPKSKRAKVVHLTKTDKKGKELSQRLFANVQEAADTFQYMFVFAVENMRNSYLKEVRAEYADSRYAHLQSSFRLKF
jgi:mRNA turnover protein 4